MPRSRSLVRPGTPLNGLPASLANHWTAGANAALGLDLRREPARLSGTSAPAIYISNESGADKDRFAVLAVGESAFDVDAENHVFASTSSGLVAVLQEPIKSSNVGRAVVSGVTKALVDVSDVDHQYAKLSGGKLISAATGSVKILDNSNTTGDDLVCLVWLQSFEVNLAGNASGNCDCVSTRGGITPVATALFGNAGFPQVWRVSGLQAYLNQRSFLLTGSTIDVEWVDVGTTDWSGTSVNRWQSDVIAREVDAYTSDDYRLHVVEDENQGIICWLELDGGTGSGSASDELYWVFFCDHPNSPNPAGTNTLRPFYGTDGTKTFADGDFIGPDFCKICVSPVYSGISLGCLPTGSTLGPPAITGRFKRISGPDLILRMEYASDAGVGWCGVGAFNPQGCLYSYSPSLDCVHSSETYNSTVSVRLSKCSTTGDVKFYLILSTTRTATSEKLQVWASDWLDSTAFDAAMAAGFATVSKLFNTNGNNNLQCWAKWDDQPTDIRLSFTT